MKNPGVRLDYFSEKIPRLGWIISLKNPGVELDYFSEKSRGWIIHNDTTSNNVMHYLDWTGGIGLGLALDGDGGDGLGSDAVGSAGRSSYKNRFNLYRTMNKMNKTVEKGIYKVAREKSARCNLYLCHTSSADLCRQFVSGAL